MYNINVFVHIIHKYNEMNQLEICFPYLAERSCFIYDIHYNKEPKYLKLKETFWQKYTIDNN